MTRPPHFNRRPTDAGSAGRVSRHILGTRVDATTYAGAVELISEWARNAESKYVCVSTVHMIMEGFDNSAYREIVNGGDLVTSDGVPLVWGLKLLGAKSATRVYGPTLTPMVCERSAEMGIPVGFYGSAPETLARMTEALTKRFPTLDVVYQHSPPFRELFEEEIEQEIADIRNSGARILFVGLGCPKQEQWMARRAGQIPGVMIGVGAAFDFIAGQKRQAPPLIQSLGLEWLFRLVTEPRRLWRRYLYNNPRFVLHFGRQLVRLNGHRGEVRRDSEGTGNRRRRIYWPPSGWFPG